jgi:hypothetical protein
MNSRNKFALAVAALAVLTLVPNGSRADLITLNLNGPITFMSENMAPWFALGDPITISGTIDPALAVNDMNPDSSTAFYSGQGTNTSPLLSISFSHENYSITVNDLSREAWSDVSIVNNGAGPEGEYDQFGFRLQGLGEFGQLRIDTNTFLGINAVLGAITVQMLDFSAAVFSDDSMPASVDVNQFDATTLMLSFYDNDTGSFLGFIASTEVVPEPGTLGLLLTAGSMLLVTRQRRRLLP